MKRKQRRFCSKKLERELIGEFKADPNEDTLELSLAYDDGGRTQKLAQGVRL